jgi:hypothetical protein
MVLTGLVKYLWKFVMSKKATYRAYLSDKELHKVALSIDLHSDGYMTALADAKKICTENHPNLYVVQVVKL